MSAERLFLKRAATRPFFYGRSSSARGQRPEPGRPCPRGTNQVATGRNAGLSGFSFCSSVQLKHCTAPPSQACGVSLAPETGNLTQTQMGLQLRPKHEATHTWLGAQTGHGRLEQTGGLQQTREPGERPHLSSDPPRPPRGAQQGACGPGRGRGTLLESVNSPGTVR